MKTDKGFFQPLDQASKLGWIWWVILLLFVAISFIEDGYKMNWQNLILFAVTIVSFLMLIFRRKVYITGSKMFFGSAFTSSYEKVDLDLVKDLQLDHSILSFQVLNQKHEYWLSKHAQEEVLKYIKENNA